MLPKLTSKFKKIIKISTITLITVLIFAFVGFWVFVFVSSYRPEKQFLDQVLSDNQVTITKNSQYYSITPGSLNSTNPKIIYYSGGLVEPEAYLFKLSQLAKTLQSQIFLSLPIFNLSIFDNNLADKIINEQNLQKVIIGGHSLGGISGCRFAKNNHDKIQKLFLFGSYCDQDVSQRAFEVFSLMGKRDGIINQENYQKAKIYLPKNTNFVENESLVHSNFGNYGLQKGDNPSQLSNQEVINLMKMGLAD